MNITVWTDFSKRTNSTKQPAANTGTVIANVYYKEDCDIDAPVLILASTYSNIVYAQIENKYFFVDSVTRLSKDSIQVSFVLDHMATYKTGIGNTKSFVLYDSASNKVMVDKRISLISDYTTTKNSINFLENGLNQTGSCVLTYTGQNGSGVSALSMNEVFNMLPTDTDINTQWNNLTSGASDTKDMLKKVFMYLSAYGTAAQNISSLIWIPFDIIEFGDIDLYLGGWKCPFHRHPISIRHKEYNDQINIPWSYAGWKRAYTDIYLSIPFIGTLHFDGASIQNATKFMIRSVLDRYTGEVGCEITVDGGGSSRIVGSYVFNTATPINIGVSNGYNANRFISGALDVGKSMLTGGLIGGINSAISNYSNTARTSTSIGNYDGGIVSWVNTKVECACVSHNTSDTATNLAPVLGAPRMEAKTINTLSGYIQTSSASVEIACEKTIRDRINETMDSGFYYE